MITVWLIIAVIAFIVESLTVSLVSSWFFGGAVIALILAALNVPVIFQALTFVGVSFVLLVAVRPIAMEYSASKPVLKTNLDRVIGQTAVITEAVEGMKLGAVYVLGKTWTAQSLLSSENFEVGEHVVVETIEGNRLLIKKEIVEGV